MAWGKEESYKDPYDYERKTAGKLNGGKRSIASGAVFGDMDVKSDELVIDNKRVAEGHTYRIDYRQFKKVQAQCSVEQMPAMFINFNQYNESLAVVREKDFLALLEELEIYRSAS